MHYLEAPEIRLLHQIIHHKTMHTQSEWSSLYDKLRTKVGGYSWTPECCDHAKMDLPENKAVWDLLLKKIQVVAH